MKSVTVVLRSPFLDKIPSLKNLVIYLAEHGVMVKVITTIHSDYPECNLGHPNIRVHTTPVRVRKCQLPTMVGLAMNTIKDIIFNRSDIYMGADAQGCEIILKLKKLLSLNFWNFLLEYPDINNKSEVKTLQLAERIITHDEWHSRFLIKNCGTRNNQFLYLPNSTHTKERHSSSKFLQQKLNLPVDTSIILHSGGLGKWFLCKELASSTHKLPESCRVVFHTSHNTTGSEYFKQIEDMVITKQLPVTFSLNPVCDEELDELVCSAAIGVAFYSTKELGYKAEYMGVAAGKIGNYLKCGVPVICTNLSSLKYIEEYKCGVLINSFDELMPAVKEILKNRNDYRLNAYRCYKELWEPTRYLQRILSEVNCD